MSLQIRGSIPLHWSQPQPWKLKPPITLNGDLPQDSSAVLENTRQLLKQYTSAPSSIRTAGPSLYLVNLIDKKGSQGALGQRWIQAIQSAFNQTTRNERGSSTTDSSLADRSVISSEDFPVGLASHDSDDGISTVRYLWFDYHNKVKKEGVKSIRDIFRHISQGFSLKHGGIFIEESSTQSQHNPTYELGQRQIIRTNCIDCLDRTNVIQTAISRWALFEQLRALVPGLAVIPRHSLQCPDIDLEQAFRSIWADNGDHISTLYAGSKAMKRDVTRTGVRTKRGVLDDAVSFAQRYIANNYHDSTYQSGLDMLIGDKNLEYNMTLNPWPDVEESAELHAAEESAVEVDDIEYEELIEEAIEVRAAEDDAVGYSISDRTEILQEREIEIDKWLKAEIEQIKKELADIEHESTSLQHTMAISSMKFKMEAGSNIDQSEMSASSYNTAIEKSAGSKRGAYSAAMKKKQSAITANQVLSNEYVTMTAALCSVALMLVLF